MRSTRAKSRRCGKTRKCRKTRRRQRGGGEDKTRQLQLNGFELFKDIDGEEYFKCGERAIPISSLLSRNVSEIKCEGNEITGLNTPRKLTVRERAAALAATGAKGADGVLLPPTAKGGIGTAGIKI
jgi:hypothetical protein